MTHKGAVQSSSHHLNIFHIRDCEQEPVFPLPLEINIVVIYVERLSRRWALHTNNNPH
jgi:hypothetical protein